MNIAVSSIPLAAEVDRTVYHQIPGQGTLVPKSRENTDGRSFAFDAERPSTRVIVDPGVEGGGFVVDYSTLAGISQSHVREVTAAAASHEACVDFLRGAAQLQKESAVQPVVVSPVPSAIEAAATAIESLLSEVTPTPPPSAGREQEPELSYISERATPIAQDTVSLQADLQAIFSLLRQQQQQLSLLQKQDRAAEIAQPSVAALLTPPPAREPMASRVQAPALSPEPAARPSAVDELVKSLEMPFISLDGPQAPTYQVVFDFPDMGTVSARYHAVIIGRQSLVLVYDTRFVNGYYFMPPTRQDEAAIEVSVPKLSNKRYSCGSLGIEFTVGCLDVVVLLVIDGGSGHGEERGN